MKAELLTFKMRWGSFCTFAFTLALTCRRIHRSFRCLCLTPAMTGFVTASTSTPTHCHLACSCSGATLGTLPTQTKRLANLLVYILAYQVCLVAWISQPAQQHNRGILVLGAASYIGTLHPISIHLYRLLLAAKMTSSCRPHRVLLISYRRALCGPIAAPHICSICHAAVPALEAFLS